MLHPNHNILSQINERFKDIECQTGIKITDEDLFDQMKIHGIYDWFMKRKNIEYREKKLKRILKNE